ncbi:metal-dependent transcriptional regulator [Methanocella arvoryzae]|uniref:metal-dependent transcriptional regulator n=1 Tax=Methanocella arvoryzae TaxID=1175445 RepID=UPI0009D9F118|nr:metal-dependent transcriptional regulator [Methanocella arvoryzae]
MILSTSSLRQIRRSSVSPILKRRARIKWCPAVSAEWRILALGRYEKYGGIVLTPEGEEIARTIKDRHDTLVRLLSIAGVPADIADKDACVIEHHLSPKSLEQLKKLVAALEGGQRAQAISIAN